MWACREWRQTDKDLEIQTTQIYIPRTILISKLCIFGLGDYCSCWMTRPSHLSMCVMLLYNQSFNVHWQAFIFKNLHSRSQQTDNSEKIQHRIPFLNFWGCFFLETLTRASHYNHFSGELFTGMWFKAWMTTWNASHLHDIKWVSHWAQNSTNYPTTFKMTSQLSKNTIENGASL